MPCDPVPVTVGELARALERRYPAATAEPWDRVGLIHGDPTARLRGVLVTLDATAEAVSRAQELGANVLVTHHPPYLEPPVRVAFGPGPDGAVPAAICAGIALIALHTNADRAPDGAEALPRALGLDVLAPLESSAEEVSVVVTYVPHSHEPAVREAMSVAGAGVIGEYDGCAFTVTGQGLFVPRADARPAESAREDGVPETRIEMVAPRSSAGRVLAAARDAHPYEEPVVIAVEALRARGSRRLGRVCTWGGTLGELAGRARLVLGIAPRVWGEAGAAVRRVAVANGSGGMTAIRDAVDAGADVLLTGEVRYHDALAASARGLALIEVGHDASEWPLVAALGDQVRRCVDGAVPVAIDAMSVSWWTMEDAHVGC